MFCIRETVHAREGGIKYLEIIVFGFINMSKERKKKVMIEKISLLGHFVVTRKTTVIKTNTCRISNPN